MKYLYPTFPSTTYHPCAVSAPHPAITRIKQLCTKKTNPARKTNYKQIAHFDRSQ